VRRAELTGGSHGVARRERGERVTALTGGACYVEGERGARARGEKVPAAQSHRSEREGAGARAKGTAPTSGSHHAARAGARSWAERLRLG
jgi:hypothetical protein